MMTWEEINIMSKAGMDIGAHTLFHRSLTNLSIETAEEEIFKSKITIKQNTRSPVTFFVTLTAMSTLAFLNLSKS